MSECNQVWRLHKRLLEILDGYEPQLSYMNHVLLYPQEMYKRGFGSFPCSSNFGVGGWGRQGIEVTETHLF